MGKTTQIGFRVSEELKDRFRRRCIDEGHAQSIVLTRAVEFYARTGSINFKGLEE